MNKFNLAKYIENGQLKLHVITNAKENLIDFDKGKNVVIARIKAQPRDNLANKEILSFLKKEFGLKCFLIKGRSSREKVFAVDFS